MNQNLFSVCLSVFATLFFLNPASALTTNFFDGFEGGLSSAWSVGDTNAAGPTAYWGVVNSAFGGEGTHSGSNKIYCAGVGFAGTTAAPFYQNSMLAYLQRTVDLTNYTTATLSFWHRIPSIEVNFDAVRIYIDGAKIWEITNSAVANWTNVNISLTPYVGASRVLKFEFYSDSAVTNEGWYLDDIQVTDQALAGTNDSFAAAQTLFNATGSVNGNNFGATQEAGEPNPLNLNPSSTNTVWFKWTAPTNGLVTFDTAGSSFDTVMCIYSGSVLASLVSQGCNDDAGGGIVTSLVTFTAIQGTTYRIQVSGYTNAVGQIILNWNQPNAAGVDKLPDLTIWADQGLAFLYGWYLDRNEPTKPGRTLMRLSTATPNIGTGALELRGNSQSPDVYQRIYRNNGTYYEHYAGTFTFHPAHGHLHFDNWMNYKLRSVLTNNGVGEVVVAGEKTSFNISDTNPYNLSLPGAPAGSFYPIGNSYTQGLSVGWCDIYGATLTGQWIDITDLPAGQYWLEAVVNPDFNIVESNYSNNVGRILIDLNPVANDHFTNAILITGVTTGIAASTDLASLEAGEPNHAGVAGVSSIWYKWVAPSNMSVTLSTEGSSFDTLLAVYTGTAVNSLTPVASNNNISSGNTNSRVTFSATGGTTYRIAVAGVQVPGYPGIGQKGTVQLHFNPAFNDNFASAITITGNTGAFGGSNRGATRQAGEPVHAGTTSSNSIWYNWTATNTVPVTFDTIGSTFDTLLAIYTGSSVGSLTLTGSDRGSAGPGASRVMFNATNGITYRIAVDGATGSVGVAVLNWTDNAKPAITSQPASTNAYAGANVFFNVSVSGAAPFGYQWRYEGNPISNNSYINGATSPQLTISKIITFDTGLYTVVITNSYGSITSAAANLIVINNPRVAYAENTDGPVGGTIAIPLRIQSLGDEHAINFSILFDPTKFTNPRLTNGSNSAGAILSPNSSLLGSGKFGGTVTLPLGQVLPAGNFEWAKILLDSPSGLTNGTVTAIGFGDQPVAKGATATNGAPLVAIFYAGNMTLYRTTASTTLLTNGLLQINLTGVPNRSYLIECATNFMPNITNTVWLPITTNLTSPAGALQFTDTQSTNFPTRFYRARLLP